MEHLYSIELEFDKRQYELLKELMNEMNKALSKEEAFTLPEVMYLLLQLGMKKMREDLIEAKMKMELKKKLEGISENSDPGESKL